MMKGCEDVYKATERNKDEHFFNVFKHVDQASASYDEEEEGETRQRAVSKTASFASSKSFDISDADSDTSDMKVAKKKSKVNDLSPSVKIPFVLL